MSKKIILIGHSGVELFSMRLTELASAHSTDIVILDDLKSQVEDEKPDWKKIMGDLPTEIVIPIKPYPLASIEEPYIDDNGIFKKKSARQIRREAERAKHKFKRKYR